MNSMLVSVLYKYEILCRTYHDINPIEISNRFSFYDYIFNLNNSSYETIITISCNL